MPLIGVRGATTTLANTPEAIQTAVVELMLNLLQANSIKTPRIIGAFFTVTPDLTAWNPARAIREAQADWQLVPMICMQEATVEYMLPNCIRVLVQWEAPLAQQPIAVYLHGAKILRPDLSEIDTLNSPWPEDTAL